MRLQLALNVRNLEEAVDYYSKLLNAEPHKIRSGYANFAVADPPLKLVLFENAAVPERLNHLGVEVFTATELAKAAERLHASDMIDRKETGVTCCHATQDKVWSAEPQGLQWEWYLIKDDNPDRQQTTGAVPCCTPTCCA